MAVKTASLATTYKHVMDGIAAGEPVERGLFYAAVAYATKSKRRTPKTDNLFDREPTKPAKITSDGVTAKKAPVKKAVKKTVKTPAKKTVAAPKEPTSKVCIEDDCDFPAYAKGRCSKHYTSHRRQDPAQKELANQASREYRARMAL